jgi:hypothetical protein
MNLRRNYPGIKQLVNGKLAEVQEVCIKHAVKTFNERHQQDTNPRIVQMIHHGTPLDHWYYRSDQWIDQPYLMEGLFIQPHVGPANMANRTLYRKEGTYREDEEATKDALNPDIWPEYVKRKPK